MESDRPLVNTVTSPMQIDDVIPLEEQLIKLAFKAREQQKKSDELGSIRATLLVNFGADRGNKYGLEIFDYGSTLDLLMTVLRHFAGGKSSSCDNKCHENRHFQAAGKDSCECGKLFLMGNDAIDVPLIDRLTAALHANMKHPDFIYRIVPVGGSDNYYFESEWEKNEEWPGTGAGVDICWRKRVGP